MRPVGRRRGVGFARSECGRLERRQDMPPEMKKKSVHGSDTSPRPLPWALFHVPFIEPHVTLECSQNLEVRSRTGWSWLAPRRNLLCRGAIAWTFSARLMPRWLPWVSERHYGNRKIRTRHKHVFRVTTLRPFRRRPIDDASTRIFGGGWLWQKVCGAKLSPPWYHQPRKNSLCKMS